MSKNSPISIGKQVQALRKSKNLTQEELARLSAVSYHAITKIESEKIKKPSFQVLEKIAKALNEPLGNFSKVEVHENIQSVEKIWEDILLVLKKGDIIFISGVDKKKYLKFYKSGIKNFLKKLKENGLKQKILIQEGDSFHFDEDFIEYRSIPPKYFYSSPIYVYADRIASIVWKVGKPQSIILKDALLAEAYRRQFLFIWDKAKKIKNGRKVS